MKQKLLAALEQRYGGAIGSKNEIYEKVVTAYGNLITSEEQIPDIVAGVEPLLKHFQSVNDKLRAFENKQKPEPTPRPSDNGNQPNPNPEPKPQPQENPVDMAKIIAEAVATAIKPISDELAGFKAEKTVNDTIAAVNTRIDAWGYGKGYPKEMEKARKNAMELYEAYGKKWSADELEAKIKEKFNQEVYDKGLDTTKPYDSDGGAGTKPDFSADVELLKKDGVDFGE